MAERFSGPDAPIEAVQRQLEDLECRLRTVEANLALTPVTSVPPAGARPMPFPGRGGLSGLTIATLAGRTSLVLAGGYLLRALTASNVIPPVAGVTFGLIYAIAWIAMADRAAAAQRQASACAHAIAAAAVACPLLYEALTRFHVLDPWTLAVNLTVVVLLGIAVGWYRWVQAIVWIFTAAAIVTALLLMRAIADEAPVVMSLVVLATVAYWIVHARPWWRLRWVAALVADGAMLKLAWDAAPPAPVHRLAATIAVGSVLFGASVGSVAARMLVLGADVVPFDITQSAAALLVGYGGAAWLAHLAGWNGFAFSAIALIVGAAAYAVAFTGVERKNFLYFSLLALAMIVTGGILAFRPDAASLLWLALAVGATWLGKRLTNVMLNAQGAAYVTAAAAGSGLLLAAARAVVGGTVPDPAAIAPIALVTLGVAAACAAISPVSLRTFGSAKMASIAGRRPYLRLPRTVVLGLLAVTLSGVIVVWLLPAIGPAAGRALGWGLIATIRSAVLALSVVALALMARHARVIEAAWLVYPLLVATGLKILLEDFRQSEPAMLFVTLVVYGTVLIVAPKLAHGSPSEA